MLELILFSIDLFTFLTKSAANHNLIQCISSHESVNDNYLMIYYAYRQISNIRRTKSQTLNVSCLVLLLSLSNPLKPDIKSTIKM